MKYNLKLALLITAIVILASIFIGGGHTLSKKYDQTKELFYSGTEGDNLSIFTDIKIRRDGAYNLLTVAGRYLNVNSDVISDLRATLASMESALSGDSISALYDTNENLTVQCDALYGVLNGCNLSEYDKKLVSEQYTAVTSAALTISRDGYNAKASAMNAALGRFPPYVIAFVNGIHVLELFR